jgi:hypothetical protein
MMSASIPVNMPLFSFRKQYGWSFDVSIISSRFSLIQSSKLSAIDFDIESFQRRRRVWRRGLGGTRECRRDPQRNADCDCPSASLNGNPGAIHLRSARILYINAISSAKHRPEARSSTGTSASHVMHRMRFP